MLSHDIFIFLQSLSTNEFLNGLFQNAPLTVVDCDGTITATRAPNIFPCTVNLDSQKYSQLRILEKPILDCKVKFSQPFKVFSTW